jgi:GNAT superfamily N-acetyltransferase
MSRELYDRGAASMVASWAWIARGAEGAAVVRAPGVAAAVFPAGPERDVYNNALLVRGLGDAGRAAAVDAMEELYAAAGLDSFAAWAHETDRPLVAELERRGYRLAETTRAMGMALDELAVPAAPVELRDASWPDYLRYLAGFGLPDGLLAGVDASGFQVVAARLDGETVATGLAFEHEGDCGIFNVSTLEPARRRGIGTALTARLLQAGRARGCVTATLQSTPMAERVYAAVGFRDLGRILEFTPPPRADRGRTRPATRRASPRR